MEAAQQFDKTPEQVKESVQQLRNLIQDEEPSLKLPDDDTFLLRFLRVAKYDTRKASDRLRKYFNARLQHKPFYDKLTLDYVKLLFEHKGVHGILPIRDEEGSPIIYIPSWDCNTPYLTDIVMCTPLITFDWLAAQPECQIHGVVFLVNGQGVGLRQQLGFIRYVGAVMNILFQSIPIRVKAIHLVHENIYTRILFRCVWPLMSQKMRDRIHLHGNNIEQLHSMIEPKCLPQELKGTNPKFDNSKYTEDLLKFVPEWLINYTHYGYDKE